MSSKTPLLLRLVAASISTSHRAGQIIRDIMQKGELGIVEKVSIPQLPTTLTVNLYPMGDLA